MTRRTKFAIIFTTVIPACCLAAPSRLTPSASETVTIYGRSVDDRPLVAVTLGTGSNVTLILGGIHGNERSAPGVVEDLKNYLEQHPDELAGSTVVLISHVNPDGDAAGTRANAHGVDLNRNFPVRWMPKRAGIALSTGSGPLSEPESSALAALLDLVKPAKIVSIHQPLDCLLPSGPGGEVLAKAMGARNSYSSHESAGYPTPGSFGSYCYRTEHIAAVTLEMPKVDVATAWAQNRAALLAAIHLPASAVSE